MSWFLPRFANLRRTFVELARTFCSTLAMPSGSAIARKVYSCELDAAHEYRNHSHRFHGRDVSAAQQGCGNEVVQIFPQCDSRARCRKESNHLSRRFNADSSALSVALASQPP
jgi:hypothetical protein